RMKRTTGGMGMTDEPRGRREFLMKTAAGLAWTAGTATRSFASAQPKETLAKGRMKFSAIGLNHNHIYGQTEAGIRGGGQLVSVFAKEPDLLEAYRKRFPQARAARSEAEILEDDQIRLVVSASIASERASVALAAMRHGKDVMVDKPGATSLEQLAEIRRVQRETKRIYSILYSERHENKAAVRAGELVQAGAIGGVIQTVGLGPHRMTPKTRPSWFFEREQYGGILCDIASHQFDQFLFFTGSKSAEIVASQVGNVHHPEYPGLED